MVRTFVALELPGEIRERLAEAREELRACRARLTFVDPALIHITAKFLGEVEEGRIPALKEALGQVKFAPFPVTARAITVNNPRRPHTVWCAMEDGGKGAELLCRIEDALCPLGFAREERRFTPHATVARVRAPDPSLFAALDRLRCREYGGCTIAGMKLKKSTLTPRGPIYEDLLEVPF